MHHAIRHAVVVAAAATALTGGLLTATGTSARAADDGPALPRYADDFNGDGYRDLALSDPTAQIANPAGYSTGFVTVSYGSKDGLRRTGLTPLTQGTPGVDGTLHNDAFGEVLANADFNDDGYADLAVGTPMDQAGTGADRRQGTVTLFWGSRTGLHRGVRMPDGQPAGAQVRFGCQLAAGDFNGDGTADLVVGEMTGGLKLFTGPFAPDGRAAKILDVPGFGRLDTLFHHGALVAGRINAGAPEDLVVVSDDPASPSRVLLGGAGGLRLTRTGLTRGKDGVIADFDGDGYGDVAIGSPTAKVDDAWNEGRTVIRYGGAFGVQKGRPAQVVTENSPGVPGEAAGGDRFGTAVAAGDVTGDGYADLVVSAYGEGGTPRRGMPQTPGGGFYVLKGGKAGVATDGARFYDYTSPGMPAGDGGVRFAEDLKVADHDDDGVPEVDFQTWDRQDTGARVVWSLVGRRGAVAGGGGRVVGPPVGPVVLSSKDFGAGFTG